MQKIYEAACMILCELAQLVQEKAYYATSCAEKNDIDIHTQLGESSSHPVKKTAPGREHHANHVQTRFRHVFLPASSVGDG